MAKRKGLTLHLPVTIEYEEGLSTVTEAVDDFYAALDEAERAGHFNRTVINIAFAEYVKLSPYIPIFPEED